ncbi:hypothetical protein JCM8208_007869 [Rhodotorula glutinis]
MSSSSELEVVSRPRKPSSSPEVRRSGRARRAPRGPDATARPAAPMARTGSGPGMTGLPGALGALHGETVPSRRREADDSDGDLLPPIQHAQAASAAARQGPVASTSRMQLPPLPPLPPLPSLPPLGPTTTSTSAALNPSSSAPALGTASAPKPAPARSTSLAAPPQPVARRSRTPTDRTSAAPALPPRAAPPPKASYSSDEADDFFGARKPKPKMRVPAAARASSSAAAGGATAQGRASSGSATPRPTSPAKRPRPPTLDLSSSSSSDSDSSPRRNAIALSSDSDNGRSTKLTKALKLPAWTMQGSTVSGADRKRAAQGGGRNRKRKKLGESGSEAEVDECAGGRAGSQGKGKGKEKAAVEEGGSLKMGDDGDDHNDTDDSLELALVRTSKLKSVAPASSPPKLPPLRSSRKASARPEGLAVPDRPSAGPSPSASPYRSPRRALPNPHALLSSSPQHASHISLSSTSSDGHAGAMIALGSDDDDDDMPIDATLAAIRKSLAAARRDAATTSTAASRARSGAGAKPFSSPVKAASASPGGPSVRGGAGARATSGGAAAAMDDGEKVTVRLRMVFDPTRQAPEVAKRAYEREEVVEMGLHEPFESLFYELSLRRSIPRGDLVITHLRPSSSTTTTSSTSTSSQTLVSSSSSASIPASTKQTQLYEFGTAASLGLRSGAEPEMRAYTRDVWTKVREAARVEAEAKRLAHEDEVEAAAVGRARAAMSEEAQGERVGAGATASSKGGTGAVVLDLEDDDDDDEQELLPPPGARTAAPPSSDPPSPAAATAAATASTSSPTTAAVPAGLFPLTLRSSRTQSLSLAVKPSTTVTQLVRAFCRHFAIPPARQAKVVVEFDGERLQGAMTLDEARDEFDLEGEETFELRELA